MNIDIVNQAHLFIIFMICGNLIGIFFDVFRILRKSFKTADFVTYIEDIIFVASTGMFLVAILFKYNNGELRLYIFGALLIGIILYMITLSRLFIKFNVKIIKMLKKVVTYIFLYPLKKILIIFKSIILKIFLKPFRIITININKKFKNNSHKKRIM